MARSAEPGTVPPTARSAQVSACGATGHDHPVGQGGRGPRSDFTLGLRIVGLPRGEQASLGAGRSGEHPQQPGQASRRALETWQEARTRAAAAVSAALSRITAASSSRRSRSCAAAKAQPPVPAPRPRRLRHRRPRWPGRTLRVHRQRLVGTQRRRGPVGQSRAAGHDLSRPRVQFPPARRTEIGVDRRPVQRMGKGQLRAPKRLRSAVRRRPPHPPRAAHRATGRPT
jgi:hypothetical protein